MASNASKLVDLTADSDSDSEGVVAVPSANNNVVDLGDERPPNNKINAVILPKSVDKPMKHVPSFGGRPDSVDNKQNNTHRSLIPEGSSIISSSSNSDIRETNTQKSIVTNNTQQNKISSNR